MTKPNNNKSAPIYRWFESNNVFIALDQIDNRLAPIATTDPASERQQQDSVTDLHDAVLLAEYEPLLQCLAAIIGEDQTWCPVRKTSAPLHEMTQMPRITATLKSLQGTSRTVYLAIPINELSDVPAVPEQWQLLVKFESHIFHFHPCLQSCVLSEQEVGKLMPGSMVLLEGAFDDTWPINLTVQSELTNLLSSTDFDYQFTDIYSAFLNCENQTIRVLQNDDAVNKSVGVARDDTLFLIDEPITVNRLYMESAWQARMNFVLSLAQSLEHTRVRVVQPTANNPTGKTLFGTLRKVGAGYGVLVDEEKDL